MARLITHPLEGTGPALDRAETTIGRAKDAHIRLPEEDKTASRRHAVVRREGDRYTFTNLSDNGTEVRGLGGNIVRLGKDQSIQLRTGVTVWIGRWQASFDEEELEPAETIPRTSNDVVEIREDAQGAAQARSQFALLLPRDASDQDKGWTLRGMSYTVGRAPGCYVRIDHPQVAPHHCEISRKGATYRVRDLGSPGGIKVNGLKVSEAELPFEAELKLGEGPDAPVFRLARKVSTEILGANQHHVFEGMIGRSRVMREKFTAIQHIAGSDESVLIRGETGTGKELVARAIHRHSFRSTSGSFVALNIARIDEHLADNELFGHEKGAYTGADKIVRGAFERAHKGTLFLDEIGDLPLALQPKLLRALQEGEIQRLGSEETIKVDVRIIAATHQPLEEMVEDEEFREDLFYRLDRLHITLPPLRARPEDVEALAYHFAAHPKKGPPRTLTEDAIRRLQGHHWRGNVRELEDVIARAVAMHPGSEPIQEGDLDITVVPRRGKTGAKEEAHRREIVEALNRNGWDRLKTAQELEVSRSTLWRWMRDLEIDESDRRAA